MARTHARHVWLDGGQFRWLDVSGVEARVEHLLTEPQPEPVRHLALLLALTNQWKSLALCATSIALLATETPEVRQLAVKLAASDAAELGPV